jgi:hypothetical protein
VERGQTTRPGARVLSGSARDVVTAKAIVATARKLTVLFWCMLSRKEEYAHQRPALTNKKLRELKLSAGAQAISRLRDRPLDRSDPPKLSCPVP